MSSMAHVEGEGGEDAVLPRFLRDDTSHNGPLPPPLPAPVRALFEHAFGDATGRLFLMALPFAVVAFVCLLFIREVPLRQTILHEDELDAVVAAELGVDQPGGTR